MRSQSPFLKMSLKLTSSIENCTMGGLEEAESPAAALKASPPQKTLSARSPKPDPQLSTKLEKLCQNFIEGDHASKGYSKCAGISRSPKFDGHNEIQYQVQPPVWAEK
jgi:hypothetical protein